MTCSSLLSWLMMVRTEAMRTARPAVSLHPVGTSLSATPPAEATPQGSPLSPAWSLRLRRPMESSQIAQSLVSLGLTLLIVGMSRGPAAPLPGDVHAGPRSSFRPRLPPTCHPRGPLESPSVTLHGQHRPQMCTWKELTLWAGAWGRVGPPRPQFHSKVSHDSDGEGPCRGGLSHVWGLQGE